ncbi:FAD-binding oxidoreductase [Aliikangiella sp. IMCC44632]
MERTRPMSGVKFITHNVTQLTEQIYRVRIKPLSGELFEFEAGQYLFLSLSENKKIPLSIASAPEEQNFIELHIRKVGEDTLASEMLDLFNAGKNFEIDGPHGRCCLKPGHLDVVIIAGGTGFSPMKSLIESALSRGDEREFTVYLGAQSSNELYQTALIESWQVINKNIHYVPVIADEEVEWQGQVGFPHQVAIENLGEEIKSKEFFISGSEPMVLNVYQALLSKGVDKSHIYSDIIDIKRDMGHDL